MIPPISNARAIDSADARQATAIAVDRPQLCRRHALSLLIAAAAVPVVSCLSVTRARSQASMTSFELAPGVVVDLDRNQAFVMTPQRGVAAINLVQGTEVWRSSEGSVPLAVEDDVLLCQLEAPVADNNLLLVGLDVRNGGRPLYTSRVALPAGVKALVGSSRASTFAVEAQVANGEARIAWEHVQQAWQGRHPDAFEIHPGESSPDPDPNQQGSSGPAPDPTAQARFGSGVAEGEVRVNLRSGAVSEQQVPAPRFRSGRSRNLAPNARLAGLPGVQVLSADNRYVLSSERIANDSVWEKYRWSVYDRNTTQKVGEILEQFSSAPFTVVASRIVYLTGPYSRRTGSGMVTEPVQICSVDLGTGTVVWRRPIRDTVERRPAPP